MEPNLLDLAGSCRVSPPDTLFHSPYSLELTSQNHPVIQQYFSLTINQHQYQHQHRPPSSEQGDCLDDLPLIWLVKTRAAAWQAHVHHCLYPKNKCNSHFPKSQTIWNLVKSIKKKLLPSSYNIIMYSKKIKIA
jgi:hypothetical protein